MADVAFQCPLLRLGGTEETKGSFESRSRCPLVLEDLRIDVKLILKDMEKTRNRDLFLLLKCEYLAIS